jgi:hypothetical protein
VRANLNAEILATTQIKPVIAGLDPAIQGCRVGYRFLQLWMPGSSPGMTKEIATF